MVPILLTPAGPELLAPPPPSSLAGSAPAGGTTRDKLLGFDQLLAGPVQTLPLGLATVLLTLPPLALPLLTPGSALAQKRIPKLPGYDQCPLGYVNDLKQHCNSPIYYEVKPTDGKPCDSGWMNIGAGYCKKKTLGIF
ncbi:hypothetical protein IFHNHDMJ_01682 [Synechococcus sp. CBW1107]|nr:hypothetical protein IFHNHDMJ_01682 [Synechococcus sp. CBW1107]